jgi:type II secretory pathway component PulM
MAEETFADYIERERQRLQAEREAVLTEQRQLEDKLAGINREFLALDAYESAKTGRPVARTLTRSHRPATIIARRGSKREELLNLLQRYPDLKRAEILDRMGLKGDKAGEMSVSNALTALTKSNQLVRSEGKYRIA